MINSFEQPHRTSHTPMIIGGAILLIILALLASFYGRFLKTDVSGPSTAGYTAEGNLTTADLEPDTYTLEFVGQSGTESVTTTSTFQVTVPETSSQPSATPQSTTEPTTPSGQLPEPTTAPEATPEVQVPSQQPEPLSATVQPTGEPTPTPPVAGGAETQ